MAERPLEELFACFRDEHALDALAEVFDRTAPRLLEVARHLSARRGEAEDLVQSTFLAAIEAAPRFEDGRRLVPWLVGILVHKARRARERRAEERLDGGDPFAPDAAEPAARAEEAELANAVADALARMPAREREVLRAHLADEQPAHAIARELGRTPGAVRVQIHRGLRRLRRLLPAGFALGTAALLAPRGLAAVRAHVLRAAAHGPEVLAPAAALSLGGMLVTKKLALAALALLVTVSVWWSVRSREGVDGIAPTPSSPPTMALAGAPSVELAVSAADARRTPAVPDAAPVEQAAETALVVDLAWWDGTAAADVLLSFHPSDARQPNRALRLAHTDGDGRARVAGIHPGHVAIVVERMTDVWFETDVEAGATTSERCVLPRGCDVVGRVLDERGAPVAGAQLWVGEVYATTPTATFMNPARATERSRADGSFRIRSVVEGAGVFATADGLGSSRTTSWDLLETVDPHTRSVELRLRGESAELAGTVRDAAGAPVADARVAVRCFNSRVERAMHHWPHVLVTTDAQGTFRVGGLHEGAIEVRVAAAGFALAKRQLVLASATDVDFVLDAGFSVRGSVARSDGSPVSRARVRADSLEWMDAELDALATTTDERGEFVLDLVPAGDAVVVVREDTADTEEATAQKSIRGSVGDVITWDVVFGSGPSIRGAARDGDGRPLAGWRVRAYPTAGARGVPSGTATTDERGAFTVTDVAEASYSVHLFAPGDDGAVRARLERVLPGDDAVELVARGELTPSAFLHGRVLDPDGTPVRASLWARRADGAASVGNPVWADDERFRIGPMFSGAYELAITVAGLPTLNLPVEIAEGEELDLGDVALPRPGHARLTLRALDGAALPQPLFPVLWHGRYIATLTSTDGVVFESDALFPGTYRFAVMSGAAAPAAPTPIEIRAGDTTVTELRLAAGRSVRFDFAVREGERLPARVDLEVRDAAGVPTFAQAHVEPQTVNGQEYLLALTALPFGRFAFVARGAGGFTAAGEFEVVPGPEPQQPVRILLARSH